MPTKLLDPDSTSHHVAAASLMGAWALIDPNRPTRAGQWAFRIGSAAMVGASFWVGARDLDGEPLSERTRTALALGSAGVGLALMPASERLDARLHSFLRRRGVRRPRVLTAAFTVGMYAVSRALERWAEDHDGGGEAEEAGYEFEPLDDRLRALLMAILEQTEDHGSLALRAQLAQARRVRLRGEREVPQWVPFDIDEDAAPLAVPANAVFPVRARYATRRGALDLQLQVADGVLDAVGWELVDPTDPDEPVEDTLDVDDILGDTAQWPTAEEVLLLVETSRGLEPVVR